MCTEISERISSQIRRKSRKQQPDNLEVHNPVEIESKLLCIMRLRRIKNLLTETVNVNRHLCRGPATRGDERKNLLHQRPLLAQNTPIQDYLSDVFKRKPTWVVFRRQVSSVLIQSVVLNFRPFGELALANRTDISMFFLPVFFHVQVSTAFVVTNSALKLYYAGMNSLMCCHLKGFDSITKRVGWALTEVSLVNSSSQKWHGYVSKNKHGLLLAKNGWAYLWRRETSSCVFEACVASRTFGCKDCIWSLN